MPSVITHAVAGICCSAAVAPGVLASRRWRVVVACCAALPDIDGVGIPLGIRSYAEVFGGHRGATHSMVAASVVGLAGLIAGGAWRDLLGAKARLWAACAIAAISHLVLDSMTSYGVGVALLWPFSDMRTKAPWLPITGEGGLQSAFANILSEVIWGWLPALTILGTAFAIRACVAHLRTVRTRSLRT